MAAVIQPSFARGEIGPELYARVDTQMYAVALRKARNVTVSAHGGVSNRTGTQFIGPVKDHTAITYLRRFQFNTTDTYILEFGNLYMRVIRNDGHVVEDSFAISNITQADPAVVTSATHSYVTGDEVFLDEVVGMTEVNQRRFTITVLSGTTFSLQDQVTGIDVDSTGFTAYGSAGTTERIYEIATPYVTADLSILKSTQSADVMTLTHPTYGIRELTRTDHDAWTLTEPTFAPSQIDPTTVAVAAGAGAITDLYAVTAINGDDFEESLTGIAAVTTASASATNANPVVVTAASHPYVNGDEIEMSGYTQMTEVNGRRFTVANKTTHTFELTGEDGTGYTAESSGGSVNATFAETTTSEATRANTITWAAVAGATRYAVYYRQNGIYGFIGETELQTFLDDNITADTSINPPKAANPFRVAGDFPGTVSYFEQRRVFAGSDNEPDTSKFSQTGNHNNFTVSQPTSADDAITTTLNSRQVNEIRHFVPLNDLLVLTSGSEWRINSSGTSGFEASTLRQKPQTHWGSAHLPPFVVGSTVLFMHENLTEVRTIGFSFEADGYVSSDLNLLAPHIFSRYSALDWSFVETPDPVVTTIREDGRIGALTFNQEQEVIGWATWDTSGKYETTASIRPDATEVDDAAYFTIKRTIGGNTVRYIERQHTRRFTDVQDAFFVDSGLSLDTPLPITSITAADPVVVTSASHLVDDGDDVDISDIIWVSDFDADDNETQPAQLNGGTYLAADVTGNTMALVSSFNNKALTDATAANPVVISALAHGYSDGDSIGIFNILGMVELNGNTYKVANATADTFELTDSSDVDIDGTAFTAYISAGDVYKAVDGSAFNAYVEGGNLREPFTSFGGLRHLAGRTVVALANGNVVKDLIVSATGTVTLTNPASRVHVGLKYISDVETLDIESAGGATVQGKKKKVSSVVVRFHKSRGLLIGPSSTQFVEMKQRENEVMGAPTDLLTGDKKISLKPSWNRNGRMFMRQNNPLPMTILAVIPDIDIGDD